MIRSDEKRMFFAERAKSVLFCFLGDNVCCDGAIKTLESLKKFSFVIEKKFFL